MSRVITIICCKCKRIKVGENLYVPAGNKPEPDMNFYVSHGYCPECFEEEMAAIEARYGEFNRAGLVVE
jgi:hypothetical protein